MTLSPEDFEQLVGDLLSHSFGHLLESFKTGKDEGIDLRHSRSLGGASQAIVQCKRYSPTGISALLRNLRFEKTKLDVLKPGRYILATSVRLSPKNKARILEELHPWCVGPEDIYGASELNALLRDFPEVEQAHFKLWMSSTATLKRIVNADVFALTEATVEAARDQIAKLVLHRGYNAALDLLQSNHHVVIVGNPGIGKTTLARILLCQYIQEGFEAVWVLGNISEAWKFVATTKSVRKLVIVYDDFLGRLRFDSQRFGKNEEHSLMTLLDKVSQSKHLRFILTTREYILADAQRVHGAFDERADDLISYALRIEDYALSHRATMLFNHLYFSDLPNSRLDAVLSTKAYNFVIHNPHFNPRVVEAISRLSNSRSMTNDEYIGYINQEIQDPTKLWSHAFRFDIGAAARSVLYALWSFAGEADIDDIRRSTYNNERELSADHVTISFEAAIRQLDGNFVVTEVYPSIGQRRNTIITFQNPSVEQFVDNWITSHVEIMSQIASSAINFSQIAKLHATAERDREIGSDFWQVLWKSANSVYGSRRSSVANLRVGNRIVETWMSRTRDIAEDILILLKIESRITRGDSVDREKTRRLLTASGWEEILGNLYYSEAYSSSVSELVQFLASGSGWPSHDLDEVTIALRAGLINTLKSENGKQAGARKMEAAIVAALDVRANASEEFRDEIWCAIDAIVAQSLDDLESYEIGSEIASLKRLEVLLSRPFVKSLSLLEERANDAAQEDDPEIEYPPERRRYGVMVDDDFDVDGLFLDLRDR